MAPPSKAAGPMNSFGTTASNVFFYNADVGATPGRSKRNNDSRLEAAPAVLRIFVGAASSRDANQMVAVITPRKRI